MPTQPLRVATYARYSTDMQSSASIEDQQRICHRLIADRGWVVTQDYADAAISGASLQRPGYQRLLDDARRGLFDVVAAEGLDRISRDQEHISGFFKQMQYRGIRIVTVSQGDVSEMHIGFNGVISAMSSRTSPPKPIAGLRGACARASPQAGSAMVTGWCARFMPMARPSPASGRSTRIRPPSWRGYFGNMMPAIPPAPSPPG